MRTPIMLLATVLTTLSGLAYAVDQPAPQPWEVRILGGGIPGIDRGIDGIDARISSGGEVLALYHLPIQGTPLHILAGAGVFDDTRLGKVETPDNTASYGAQGIMATVGMAYGLTPQWSLEARVEGRAGEGRLSAKQTFSNGDFEVIGDYGRYLAGSAVVGGYYALSRKVSIGLEAGWDDFRGKSDFVNHAVVVKGDGLLVRLGAGYSF